MTQRLKKFVQQHSLLIDDNDLYKLFKLADEQLNYDECCYLHKILADMSNEENDPDLDPFPHELKLVKEKLIESIYEYLIGPNYDPCAYIEDILTAMLGQDTISSFCKDDFRVIMQSPEFLDDLNKVTNSRITIDANGLVNKINRK